MNGDFASVHALKNGPVRFVLPFPCRVTNLKSFAAERVREGGLDLELTAGETVWNEITEHMTDVKANMLVIELGEALAYPSDPELAGARGMVERRFN